MKKKYIHRITQLAVVFGLSTVTVLAQPQRGGPGGAGGPPRGGPHPVPAVLKALDTNADGELDAAEIANASAALKALDVNGHGKLSADELMPPRPGAAGQSRPTPPPGAKAHLPPLMAALDTDGNGELSPEEIANASAALLKLDANGDGKLTREELRPKGPGHPGGPGGPWGANPPEGQ